MQFFVLAYKAGCLWFRNEADQYAAALAYFVPFALTPLLLISMTWVGLMVGRERLTVLLTEWGTAIDPELPAIMTNALVQLESRSDEYMVPILAIAFFSLMIIVAINSLTSGIHKLWSIESTGIRALFIRYSRALCALIVIQAYFVCLIIISGAVTWLEDISAYYSVGLLQQLLFLGVTIVSITILFRVLPMQALPLRSCFYGALVAGVLFLGLRAFVTAHVVTAPAVTLYGAASIVIILLIWFYAVGSIILYGAAFAKVHYDAVQKKLTK
jgi:membrane protein